MLIHRFATKYFSLIVSGVLSAQFCQAQQVVTANPVADRYLMFRTTDKGVRHEGIRWGLDTAWDHEGNVMRGIAFMGKENVEVVRVSFQPTKPLVGDKTLTKEQIDAVNSRIKHAKLAGMPDLIINSDHPSVDDYYTKDGVVNVEHWANMIMATTRLYREAGLNVVTISPFNEPDYWQTGQGDITGFRNICKYLKENFADELEGVRLSGGNTLNNDKAMEWYEFLKPYIDEGNTHQLAGSFDTYADFFAKVKADGNHVSADEMHNVGDALVALEYGLQTGVWWGFDSRARGQLCRATHGDRLAYAENRDAWSSAAVYRNTQDNLIECFVGGSERQAKDCSYNFVCLDRDVYFDGYGPSREFYIEYPGGKGYQDGQSNAERVIDLSWGEDVQPAPINGTYQLMNRASKRVMGVDGSANSGANICIKSPSAAKTVQWKVEPIDPRHGGDFGYYTIRSAQNNFPIDVFNWSLSSGGDIKLFDGSIGDNEQWYLTYAGDGFYYIRSRYSNLYITAENTSTGSNISQAALATTETGRKRQQWRIIPTDAKCELDAPAAPEWVETVSHPASIEVLWSADNMAEDVVGFMVLRADKETMEWNTIARKVFERRGQVPMIDTFGYLDNNVEPGHIYLYKVKAIDYSDNQSECSEAVEATTLDQRTQTAYWSFDGNLLEPRNEMHASVGGKEAYSSPALKTGDNDRSLSLNVTGEKSFVQLPYQVANWKEMTIGMWVKLLGTSTSWQRLFDFGNGTEQYMFLTPNNGSTMRFAIKNGGEEQVLDAPNKLKGVGWHHVAVTMDEEYVTLYVDGEKAAETRDITIRPADFKPVLNYLGRSQFANDPYFRGYIDNVCIFNYCLPPNDVAKMLTEANSIAGTPLDEATASAKTFDLSGRTVNGAQRPGIVIRNGKKILQK